MSDREIYYWARIVAGLAGFGIWIGVAIAEYRALERDHRFESRKRTAIYVSFPAVYSAGYAGVAGYSLQSGSLIPDSLPLALAAFVQGLAIVYGLILLRLRLR